MEDRLREALLVGCRERSIEPPGRIDRIVTAAQTRAEKAFCAWTIERLGGAGVARPVMDALELLAKYADVDGKTRFYDAGDAVPMDGVVRKDWREAVVDDRARSSGSRTSCTSSSRCGTRSAAVRSTSRAGCAGAIRRTICAATSRPPGRCITPRSGSDGPAGIHKRLDLSGVTIPGQRAAVSERAEADPATR
ncbi:hypothetical protein ACFVYD_28585 [Streptomyces sp. NPDC058301]|uniref:hypothetical protein n=1 Tax=Streptomyces sp. NPDC058301 TaxID=3346436 RepID=UPI0036E56F6C